MKIKTHVLLAVLQNIAFCIEAGDSFEGNFTYSCMEEGLEQDEWEVSATYRIGNSMGQGGMRIINRSV